MADLDTRIFIGTDERDATAQLNAALQDGSWDLVRWQGYPVLWITHRPVTPGAMQMPSYELHVTAWVNGALVMAVGEAMAEEPR